MFPQRDSCCSSIIDPSITTPGAAVPTTPNCGSIRSPLRAPGHHALRAERWDKAVDYLRQAGVKAFERSANREAASAFEQALLAIAHLPQTRETIEQTVDLCLAMRPCVTPLADMKRLQATVERAAPLIASLGNPRREALINGYHCAALTNLGRTQEALALARRGMFYLRQAEDGLKAIH